MKNRRRNFLFAALFAALLLAGCENGAKNAETEALKQQIAQLEQKIAAMEQQNTPAPAPAEAPAAQDNAPAERSETNPPAATVPATTRTLGELTSLVDAFAEKAGAASPSGNIEQFFAQ